MEKKHYNIGIFYGTILHANQGCNALNYSLISMLDDFAKKKGLSFSYYLFWDIDDSTYNHNDLPWELRKYDIHFCQEHNQLLKLKQLPKYLLKKYREKAMLYLKRVHACDLFFETGAGDSFSDIYGERTIRYINNNHWGARHWHIPLIMTSQTIGPFQSPRSRRLAKKIMDYASFVYTRDELSYKKCMEFVSADKVFRSVDMGLFLDTPSIKVIPNDKIRVGFNPSALLWHMGHNNTDIQLKSDYQKVTRTVLQILSQYPNIQVVMIPHVSVGSGEHPLEDDLWLCHLLKYEFPQIEIGPFFYTPIDAWCYLASLDCVISSRMHCCIGAYKSGVPVFTLGYSRKFEGLFENDLDYPWGADLRKCELDDVEKKLKDFLSKRQEIKLSFPARLEKLRQYKKTFTNQLEKQLEELLK